MYDPLEKANCITLNTIKACISPESRLPLYLTMLFPPELKAFDQTHLLDFIYMPDDLTLRNVRTSFANGNITRYPEKQQYARANQGKLALIARFLHQPNAAAVWTGYLEKQFPAADHAALSDMTETDAERYPDAFAKLLYEANASWKTSYLLLYLVLWAIFGEWITSAEGIFRADASAIAAGSDAEPPGRQEFCRKAFAEIKEILHVDFAFHAGDFWLLDGERIDYLLSLIRSGIHLRILVDEDAPSKLISSHMDHSERFTLPHEMILHNWTEFERRNPEHVRVRFSPVPVLRNYCCFEAANPAESAMRLVFYSYGHKNFNDYYALCPPPDSKAFAVFQEEFGYLWEQGKDALPHDAADT